MIDIEKKRLRWRRWYLKNRESFLLKQKQHRINNLEKARAADRKKHNLEKQKQYRIKNKKRLNDYYKNYSIKYRKRLDVKLKIKCRKIVFQAIKNKKIKRLPCIICGNTKSEAHHIDYNKPLQIKWLCKKHHWEQHIKINLAFNR